MQAVRPAAVGQKETAAQLQNAMQKTETAESAEYQFYSEKECI